MPTAGLTAIIRGSKKSCASSGELLYSPTTGAIVSLSSLNSLRHHSQQSSSITSSYVLLCLHTRKKFFSITAILQELQLETSMGSSCKNDFCEHWTLILAFHQEMLLYSVYLQKTVGLWTSFYFLKSCWRCHKLLQQEAVPRTTKQISREQCNIMGKWLVQGHKMQGQLKNDACCSLLLLVLVLWAYFSSPNHNS